MKMFITASLLWLAVFGLHSQGILYSESPEQQMESYHSPNGFLKVEDGHPIISTVAQKTMKTSISSLLKVDGRSEAMDYGVPYERSYSRGQWSTADKNYRLLLCKDSKTKSLLQRIVQYSDTAEPLGVITETKLEYKGYNDFPSTGYMISEDSSYIMVFRYVDDNEKNKELPFHLEIYDKEMNLEGQAEWIAPGKDGQRMYHMLSYALGDDGTGYFLIKKYNDKYKETTKMGKKAVSNYDLLVLAFSKTGTLTEYLLDNEDAFSSSYSLGFYADGTPAVIANISSSAYEDASTTGFQFFIWDASSNGFRTESHSWSEAEIEEFGKWKNTKVDGLRRYFYIEDVKSHNDKLTFLVVNTWQDWRGPRNARYQVSVSGCAFTMTINQEGKKVDHLFVPRQVETGTRLHAPLLHIANDRPVLIYNDDKKNFDKSIGKLKERLMDVKTYMITGDIMVAAAYKDESGTLHIEEIPDTKDHILYSNYSFERAENEVAVVVLEATGIFKKNLIKVATFDLTNLK